MLIYRAAFSLSLGPPRAQLIGPIVTQMLRFILMNYNYSVITKIMQVKCS